MSLSRFLFGGSREADRIQAQQLADLKQVMSDSRTDYQQARSSPLRGMREGYLTNLFSDRPEDVAAYNQPYMRTFQEEILPQVSERYGAYGGFRSTGYQNSMNQSSEGFADKLAGMRAREQSGALSALTSDYDNAFNRYSQLAMKPIDASQYGGQGFAGGALQLLGSSGIMNQLGGRAGDLLFDKIFGGSGSGSSSQQLLQSPLQSMEDVDDYQ